jgi:hypothetical protein
LSASAGFAGGDLSGFAGGLPRFFGSTGPISLPPGAGNSEFTPVYPDSDINAVPPEFPTFAQIGPPVFFAPPPIEFAPVPDIPPAPPSAGPKVPPKQEEDQPPPRRIPEPATLWLLGAALVAFVIGRRSAA